MLIFQIICLVIASTIVFVFGLAVIAPYLVNDNTKELLLCKEYPSLETVLHTAPQDIKEYTLNDGSSITVDATETEVQEKEVFDPFGFEVPDPSAPAKTPAEKIGGGMAEIIRKRREEGVF